MTTIPPQLHPAAERTLKQSHKCHPSNQEVNPENKTKKVQKKLERLSIIRQKNQTATTIKGIKHLKASTKLQTKVQATNIRPHWTMSNHVRVIKV